MLIILYVQKDAKIFWFFQEATNWPRADFNNGRIVYDNIANSKEKVTKAATFLIIYSIQDFYTEQYYTFLAVKNDDSEYLPMNIDILFNRMPCDGKHISTKLCL